MVKQSDVFIQSEDNFRQWLTLHRLSERFWTHFDKKYLGQWGLQTCVIGVSGVLWLRNIVVSED